MTSQSGWLVYEWEEAIYVPFIPTIHQGYKSLTLILNSDSFNDEYVQVWYDEPLDIFVNGKLQYSLQANEKLNLPIQGFYAQNNDSIVSIAINAQKTFKKSPNVIISQQDFVEEEPSYHFKERSLAKLKQKPLFERRALLALLLVVLALSITNRSPLNPVLNLTSLDGIRDFFTDNKSNIKLNSIGLMTYLFLFPITLSISVLVLNIRPRYFEFNDSSLFDFYGYFPLVNLFLYLFLFILSIVVLKLLITWIAGKLFNLKSETNNHLFEYIKFSHFFYLIHLSLVLISGFHPYLFENQFLVNLFIYGFLIVPLLVTLKIYRIISFNNVFIISYFCITEFVPALIMIRLF